VHIYSAGEDRLKAVVYLSYYDPAKMQAAASIFVSLGHNKKDTAVR
jgi:hypothetical protein